MKTTNMILMVVLILMAVGCASTTPAPPPTVVVDQDAIEDAIRQRRMAMALSQAPVAPTAVSKVAPTAAPKPARQTPTQRLTLDPSQIISLQEAYANAPQRVAQTTASAQPAKRGRRYVPAKESAQQKTEGSGSKFSFGIGIRKNGYRGYVQYGDAQCYPYTRRRGYYGDAWDRRGYTGRRSGRRRGYVRVGRGDIRSIGRQDDGRVLASPPSGGHGWRTTGTPTTDPSQGYSTANARNWLPRRTSRDNLKKK